MAAAMRGARGSPEGVRGGDAPARRRCGAGQRDARGDGAADQRRRPTTPDRASTSIATAVVRQAIASAACDGAASGATARRQVGRAGRVAQPRRAASAPRSGTTDGSGAGASARSRPHGRSDGSSSSPASIDGVGARSWPSSRTRGRRRPGGRRRPRRRASPRSRGVPAAVDRRRHGAQRAMDEHAHRALGAAQDGADLARVDISFDEAQHERLASIVGQAVDGLPGARDLVPLTRPPRPGRRARRSIGRASSGASGWRRGAAALVGDGVAGDLEEPDPERADRSSSPCSSKRGSAGERAQEDLLGQVLGGVVVAGLVERRSCTPGPRTSDRAVRTRAGRDGPPPRPGDRRRTGPGRSRGARSLPFLNTGGSLAVTGSPGHPTDAGSGTTSAAA